MKILIVDDHPLYVEGLRNLLESWNYTEVAVARDGQEAIQSADSFSPKVILMDINMPGMDGIAATREIKRRQPAVKVVMLTGLGEEERLFEAVEAGASGYLLKNVEGAELVRCLTDLEEGKNPFSAGLEDLLLARFREGLADSHAASLAEPALNPRQREVLDLLAQGKSYKEIGAALFISERTIKFHVARVKEILGLKTHDELAEYARRHVQG